MTTPAFCPKCGLPRPDGATFCPGCGQAYAPESAASPGWGLENPAGFRPMVVNPLVLWVFVIGGFLGGLWVGIYVLGFMLTGLAMWGALIVCPILGAALGNWIATNLLR